MLNGAIAGMAGITPVSGYIESYWAALVALIIVLGAYFSIILFKNILKIDDALDVSSVHGVTGVIGSLSIGFVAEKAVNPAGDNGLFYGNPNLLWIQIVGVSVTIIWSCIWTLVFLFFCGFFKFFKLTVEPEVELKGLDSYYHGDVAYIDLETHRDDHGLHSHA